MDHIDQRDTAIVGWPEPGVGHARRAHRSTRREQHTETTKAGHPAFESPRSAAAAFAAHAAITRAQSP
jgi:hypothetical protein